MNLIELYETYFMNNLGSTKIFSIPLRIMKNLYQRKLAECLKSCFKIYLSVTYGV